MRRIISCFVLSCLFILYLPKNPVSAMQEPDSCFHDKRACWISYLDFEQYLKGLDETSFRQKLYDMFDNIKKNDLNTIIVQVRAFGDAIYPSNIFPKATYITSDTDVLAYDPFQIMIDIAREYEICLEAWINPYRLSKDDLSTEYYKTTLLYEQYKPYIIEYKAENGETALSFNPACAEVRDLILQGIDEILCNYDVDGIHFDDYFYMDGMVNDISIDDKKKNVNLLIKDVHALTEKYRKSFGISPAGNISYAESIGADITTWLSEEGYIDYIMPQIYWSDDYCKDGTYEDMFLDRCKEWANVNTLDLPIYAGLALYKVGEEDDIDCGWCLHTDNLKRQYEAARGMGYDGYSLFRYAWLEQENSFMELDALREYNNSFTDYSILSDEVSKKQIDAVDGEIIVRINKKDGTIMRCTRSCKSFRIEGDATNVSIVYNTSRDEQCSVFYRVKTEDGRLNSWVKDGMLANFDENLRILEVQIMRIPRKNVKNACFFKLWCYNKFDLNNDMTEWVASNPLFVV